jgi:hypothetical protein
VKQQIATASRVIHASPEQIYNIIADYRDEHPRILPKQYFLFLNVEEGGYGAGTIINFRMRLLGQTQSFRSLITEPQPGRLLVETDIQSEMPTSFEVVPIDEMSRVTISTMLKGRNWIEGLIARPILEKIYRMELELLAQITENPRSEGTVKSMVDR